MVTAGEILVQRHKMFRGGSDVIIDTAGNATGYQVPTYGKLGDTIWFVLLHNHTTNCDSIQTSVNQ